MRHLEPPPQHGPRTAPKEPGTAEMRWISDFANTAPATASAPARRPWLPLSTLVAGAGGGVRGVFLVPLALVLMVSFWDFNEYELLPGFTWRNYFSILGTQPPDNGDLCVSPPPTCPRSSSRSSPGP